MRSSHKPDPPIIQGDHERSPLKLHVHLASSKQDQGVHRHHAAVSDEHSASFDFLMVQQVGAVEVSDLIVHGGRVNVHVSVVLRDKLQLS